MAGPGDAVTAGSFDGKADEVGPPTVTPTLAPAYALTLTSHVVTAKPDGSDRTTFDSRVDGYVTPVATEDGLTLHVQPCHIELPEFEDKEIIVPNESLADTAPIVLDAVFAEDFDGWLTLATETGALELGVALADPVSDALPDDDDDERLVDHDDDGKVGVTVEIDGWSVYVAARARVWIAGHIDPDSGIVAGEASLDIDAQIYGDNVPFVDLRSEVDEAVEDNDEEIVEVENAFALTPLDAVPSGCPRR